MDHTDQPQDITDPATGLSRILAERCGTCVLRPGNLMHLSAGGLAALIREAQTRGTYVICHQTLSYGDHPDFGPAICRGFADAYHTPALAILRSCHRLLDVDPPTP